MSNVPYTEAYDYLRSLASVPVDEPDFSPPKLNRGDAALIVQEIANALAMPIDELVRQIHMYAEGRGK